MGFTAKQSGSNIVILAAIPICCVVGLVYSIICWLNVSQIEVNPGLKKGKAETMQRQPSTSNQSETNDRQVELTDNDKKENIEEGINEPTKENKKNVKQHGLINDSDKMIFEIYELIREGATSFLWAEYRYLGVYIVVFGIIMFVLIGSTESGNWAKGGFSLFSFVIGAVTSIFAGWIGMKVATYSNARTTIAARSSLSEAFSVAFKGGSVMGFSLVSLGLLMLYLLLQVYLFGWFKSRDVKEKDFINEIELTMRALAGFGVGASSVALFARVGGGIYTKAADVGADLVGKVEAGIPEDDPRNPGTIADNVGDNVGDIAGMGADLFGSFAGSTCASLVLASSLDNTYNNGEFNYGPLYFGLCISAAGIVSCLISCVLFTIFKKVVSQKDVKSFLSYHELLSTIISLVLILISSFLCFGNDTYVFKGKYKLKWWKATICVSGGLIGGWIIGFVTEYYTSISHKPVKELAGSTRTGTATLIIYGLSLGYVSTGIPVIVLAINILLSMYIGGMYGVSLATLGVLATLSTALSIDAFGPIADNAGGIAEMSFLDEIVRERTDILDNTGNTTAAIGKGFAIGSACLVGIALTGAFQFAVAIDDKGNVGKYFELIDPMVLSGLLIGSMIPYIFSALTMKSVGFAALEMVKEIRRQFKEIEGIMEYKSKPDYGKCIKISTQASLKQMILPGAMVIITPLFFGFIFGTKMLSGILTGSIISGVQIATSSSNTGGAWDNAKKLIEAGLLKGCKGKGTDEHKAAVIGDTVGDPLKDTSGPALNILFKLMGIISVVFAAAMKSTQNKTHQHTGIIGIDI